MPRSSEPTTEAPLTASTDPLAYRPRAAAAAIGVSGALIFELIAEGALPARKLRGATIILRSDLVAFLEALPLTASAASEGRAADASDASDAPSTQPMNRDRMFPPPVRPANSSPPGV